MRTDEAAGTIVSGEEAHAGGATIVKAPAKKPAKKPAKLTSVDYEGITKGIKKLLSKKDASASISEIGEALGVKRIDHVKAVLRRMLAGNAIGWTGMTKGTRYTAPKGGF